MCYILFRRNWVTYFVCRHNYQHLLRLVEDQVKVATNFVATKLLTLVTLDSAIYCREAIQEDK